MSEPRLHSVARWLAGAGTRRKVLGASVGAVGTLALNGRRPPLVAAETPPPIPNGSLDGWPVCSESRRFYCVESLIVNGGVAADRLRWGTRQANDTLQPADLTREIQLRFRSGLLEPVSAFLQAA